MTTEVKLINNMDPSEYHRKYYQENKERIKSRRETNKEYYKKYYQENKEKYQKYAQENKEKKKIFYQKNKEKFKKYYQENKERIKSRREKEDKKEDKTDYNREYYQRVTKVMVECECGCKIVKSFVRGHLKTKKHMKLMEKLSK